ncbi:endo alpha-1,4 polygalactosaminidase [Marinobacterium jannaschii]|uniref:endo alpha-1,4 polygalactosaminidase n=1 Tax=Marinobacterium jannaschii TaxID=64970 RepID=UPI000569FD64|nr:endo alpha-1,4 polygalactosaminidase [Marinobacterium jannaschii]
MKIRAALYRWCIPSLLLSLIAPPLCYADWYRPQAELSWYIQLRGDLPVNPTTALVELDLFDTPARTIQQLQQSGKSVVCYFSAGTFEAWREDVPRFNSSDLGSALDNWPGEYWLDIRSDNVRRIMRARLKLAQRKNCDAVDPDNVDGYSNHNGLELSANDQLDYNRFLASQAHHLGLGIGLKNNLEQASQLEPYFDFATNESCLRYNECQLLTAFIAAGKPVLHIEYGAQYQQSEAFEQLCRHSREMRFSTVAASRELDGSQLKSCSR